MNKTAFIIHGAYGSPEENWFPWLREKLEKRGYTVIVPRFPTPEGQSLQQWLAVFAEYQKEISEESIFIGHSIAPAFILKVIEQLRTSIKAAFFVSGFVSNLGDNKFDTINQSFYADAFAWKKIQNKCQKFYLYHADDDPYVPLGKAKELAESLNTRVRIVKNAGHFNTDSGYTQFRLLLEAITAHDNVYNYAFIDGQNLYRGIKSLGWKVDWCRLRTYLAEKYSVQRAYMFIGRVEGFEWLYARLEKAGFELMFKPTIKDKNGEVKGNVDGDMILHTILKYDEYDKAVIVSSDGDFYSLVDHLYKNLKLKVVMSPYGKTCSVLLKKTAREKIVFMNNLQKRIGEKRKSPPED